MEEEEEEEGGKKEEVRVDVEADVSVMCRTFFFYSKKKCGCGGRCQWTFCDT